MGALDRRTLYYECDDTFDPNIVFNINEYLIEYWPKLSLKARTSVWTIVKDDDEFDLSSIQEQINDAVYEFAASDPEYANDPDFQWTDEDEAARNEDEDDYEEDEEDDEDYEDEDEDEDEDYEDEDEDDEDEDQDDEDEDEEDEPHPHTAVYLNIFEVIQDRWPTLTEEQALYIAEAIVEDEELDLEPLFEEFDSYVFAASEEDDEIVLDDEEDEENEDDKPNESGDENNSTE